MKNLRLLARVLFIYGAIAASAAAAQVYRTYGDPALPYATGAMTRPGAGLFFTSGYGTHDPKPRGDMRTQTLRGFQYLEGLLKEAGLSIDDVYFVRAYLAPD